MFFSIPNLSASTVAKLDAPWDYKETTLPTEITRARDKEAYRSFCNSFTTKHAFISMYEGVDPNLRVSADAGNPAYRMHGIVVDYDASTTPDMVQSRRAKPIVEFSPAYVCDTFSGNIRLIWMFEKPMLISNGAQLKKFILYLSRKLKLNKWFGGLDTAAFGNANQYYEIGTNWRPFIQGSVISSSVAEFWLFEAGKDIIITDKRDSIYDIPLELVAEEMSKRFPNRWSGPFEIGRRGVRFWDPVADNTTAAIVRKDGMQCFTGGIPFVSWKDIFGFTFVEKFAAEKFSRILENSCYDGRTFWVCRDKKWAEISKEDFTQFLRVQGLSSSRPGGGPSEIDRLEIDIKINKAVKSALPFIHFPPGIVVHKNERFLNYSAISCLTPAPPVSPNPMSWDDGKTFFPWVHEFFSNFFDGEGNYPLLQDKIQLSHFLAWLKHFYEHGLEKSPRSGQVVIIAGLAGIGKTLLSNKLMSMLVGGHEDGSSFLVEGSPWSDHLCEMPLMVIDDDLPGADHKTQLRFTSLLKKVVANMSLTYNGKYKKQGRVPWMGRIVVTCNLDPESLRILPNMELSTLDKISLFKAAPARRGFVFPSPTDLHDIIAAELPYFARFLLDWEVPSHIIGATRFGTIPYHHVELFDAANQHGPSHTVLELIRDFLGFYKKQFPKKTKWVGRAVTLYRDISDHSEIIQKLSIQQVTSALNMLASKNYGINRKVSHGSNIWEIPFDLADDDSEFAEETKEKEETDD